MKTTSTILLFLIFCRMAIAQETATLSGMVLDQSSNTSLPYATILIKTKKDSTIVTGIMSGIDGRFTIAGIPKGNFMVEVSFVGFQSYRSDWLVGDLNRIFDLGKISLLPQVESLTDVIVSAQKEIVSAGLEKKSFELSDNISQQTGSVLEAMRNLPGVTVSPDGKVALRGSEQVSVLIDGNQSSMTGYGNQRGLDNIPAANIERIEIINNPSAKYNAMGMAGIINIIYKKEKSEGLHGEMGLAIGMGEWESNGLIYNFMFRIFSVIFFLLSVFTVRAQTHTISGTIIDSASGETSIGATIYEPELKSGTVTAMWHYNDFPSYDEAKKLFDK